MQGRKTPPYGDRSSPNVMEPMGQALPLQYRTVPEADARPILVGAGRGQAPSLQPLPSNPLIPVPSIICRSLPSPLQLTLRVT